MNQIKHIDIKEFRETGFLQEANRQFFHPHGLALEVTVVEEEGWRHQEGEDAAKRVTEMVSALEKTLPHLGGSKTYFAVATRLLDILHPPGSEFISGVWDDRDDDEGVWFDFPSWPEGYEDGSPSPSDKAMRVAHERTKHYIARSDLLDKEYPNITRNPADEEPFIWHAEAPVNESQ